MSKIAKLQHLLNAVQGPAAQRLKGLDIVETNFDVAWDKLVRRYDNTRIRLFTSLEKLFQLTTVRARNVQDLNDVIDHSEEAIRALRDLECPVDYYDNWLVHCIVRKLDQSSRESWEMSQGSRVEFSTYQDLIRFLERRIQSLEQTSVTSQTSLDNRSHHSSSGRSFQVTRRIAANSAQTSDLVRSKGCVLCGSSHPLYVCQKFSAMKQPQRLELCKREGFCLSCLQRNHFAGDCPSSKNCLHCNGRHHTKLHKPTLVNKVSATPGGKAYLKNSSQSRSLPDVNVDGSACTTSAHAASIHSTVLLATASVIISDSYGNDLTVGALVDPAAERSFVSQRTASLLHLDTRKVAISVIEVGSEITAQSRMEARVTVKSRIDVHFRAALDVLVLNELTWLLPSQKIKNGNWPHIKGLDLADPHFTEPRKVDCILGADIYAQIMVHGLRQGPSGSPVAQKSVFGWLLTGPSSSKVADTQDAQVRVFHTFTEPSISDVLLKFWELEEIPKKKFLSPDDLYCEDHFVKTHTRKARNTLCGTARALYGLLVENLCGARSVRQRTAK